jgi:hypothetical protein
MVIVSPLRLQHVRRAVLKLHLASHRTHLGETYSLYISGEARCLRFVVPLVMIHRNLSETEGDNNEESPFNSGVFLSSTSSQRCSSFLQAKRENYAVKCTHVCIYQSTTGCQ